MRTYLLIYWNSNTLQSVTVRAKNLPDAWKKFPKFSTPVDAVLTKNISAMFPL